MIFSKLKFVVRTQTTNHEAMQGRYTRSYTTLITIVSVHRRQVPKTASISTGSMIISCANNVTTQHVDRSFDILYLRGDTYFEGYRDFASLANQPNFLDMF